MTVYRHQIAEAAAAVRIRGPLRYEWLGRPSRRLSAAEIAALDGARPLAGWLRDELYSSFYCYGHAAPARLGAPLPEVPNAALERELIGANAGRDGRQPGWSLVEAGSAEAVVTLDGVRARVPADAWRAEPDGTVSVPRRAVIAPAPGFLTVIGEADLDVGDGFVRAYWHVTSTGAPRLVRRLTAWLNDRAVPFRLKAADHPLRYERCDALVLFLAPDDFLALRPHLAALGRELASVLSPEVPAFTLPLVPGVGLAEDGSLHTSFGERRCALVADGIVAAFERGAPAVDSVLERFASAGIDADAPYREPALAGRHVL